jgi:hypothetical protein
MPATRFTSAATSEAPKVSRYDASTRASVTVCQNAVQLSVEDFTASAASGISTIRLI